VYWSVIKPKNIYLINFLNITMQATVKMARAGQVVIPIEVREALGLKGGDLIVIDVLSKVEKASLQEQGKN
jgi:AbrB family looped-hinge helix DNA binding protein